MMLLANCDEKRSLYVKEQGKPQIKNQVTDVCTTLVI